MTLDDIRRRVAEIEANVGDPERAHMLEDRMLSDFVEHVASRAPVPLAAMANEVLRATRLSYSRWTA